MKEPRKKDVLLVPHFAGLVYLVLNSEDRWTLLELSLLGSSKQSMYAPTKIMLGKRVERPIKEGFFCYPEVHTTLRPNCCLVKNELITGQWFLITRILGGTVHVGRHTLNP